MSNSIVFMSHDWRQVELFPFGLESTEDFFKPTLAVYLLFDSWTRCMFWMLSSEITDGGQTLVVQLHCRSNAVATTSGSVKLGQAFVTVCCNYGAIAI